MSQPPPQRPTMPTVPDDSSGPTKRWHQRGWVRGTAIGVLMFGIGASAGTTEEEITASPQYAEVMEAKQDWKERATATESKLTDAETQLAAAEKQAKSTSKATTDAATATRDAQTVMAQAKSKQRKVARRAAKLDAREAALAAREDSLESRENTQPAADDDAGVDESDSAGTDPRFRTCGEANDAGYGPYTSGVDPEYDWYIDRDGDGVNCES